MFDVIFAKPPVPVDGHVRVEYENGKEKNRRTFKQATIEPDIEELVQRSNSLRGNLWYLPTTLDGAGRFLGSWCVWVHIEQSVNGRALELIKAYNPKPTWTFWTGNGFEAIWALSTFHTDQKDLVRVLTMIAEDLGGERSFARIGARLRVPGSYNPAAAKHKNERMQYAHLVTRSSDPKAPAFDTKGRFTLADFTEQRLFEPMTPEAVKERVKTFRLDELLQQDLPETKWAVEGIVPEGLSILGGRPKAGKSLVALDIGIAVSLGRPIFGAASVAQGEALYLDLEGGEKRMQTRAKAILDDGGVIAQPRLLHYLFKWKSFDKGGYEELDAWLAGHGNCRLVIIDTWAKVRPVPQRHGNVYLDDYQATANLKELADKHRVAILLVTHTSKARSGPGGDVDYVDAIMGSTGITGAADAILVLDRNRKTNEAVLHITGRDVMSCEIPLRQDPRGRWHVREVAPDEADRPTRLPTGKALETLKVVAMVGPAPAKAISDAAGRDLIVTCGTLKYLEKRNLVEKAGKVWSVTAGAREMLG